MRDALFQLLFFSAKAFIIVFLILLLLVGILMLFSLGKEKLRGRISIKNLNKKYSETTENLFSEILPKKQLKQFYKDKKTAEKKQTKQAEKTPQKNVFVLNFNGDIKASAVTALREEVTAVIGVAKPHDEVVVRLESGGGMVHAYGLAAAQLDRFRQQNIALTVCVDKIAASGGYLMASVANKILAAPFAIIGSIGVIVQLPNFHRLLKEKHVDYEQLTAGNFKRTLTIFGHNTDEAREKLQQEIENIHEHFKNAIKQKRQQLNIEQVATGEHWLATEALTLNLVDHLVTSDDYLLELSKTANIYEITYEIKKSLGSRLVSTASVLRDNLLEKEPVVRI